MPMASPTPIAPPFYGGLVLEKSGRVLAKNLRLPIPWYARFQTSKIEQIFEEGARALLPRIDCGQMGFADGTDELMGVKTWVLCILPGGPSAIIVTDSKWPVRSAFRLLMLMLTDPMCLQTPAFLQSIPLQDKLDIVSLKVDSITSTMREAIAGALVRGELLESTDTKMANLSAAASRFHTEAKRTKGCCFGFFHTGSKDAPTPQAGAGR
jgi:hypothetical protein